MKSITLREFVDGAAGIRRAGELVQMLDGRPKSFPDIMVIRPNNDSEDYEVTKVEAAEYNGNKVDVLLGNGDLVSVPDDFRFQIWRQP